ncbi:MAG: hypothetical protein K9J81_09265 [Desulfohalobiaceae bacterium]|nr:hypothetical protein [Desulfohalobiaceae bacterium]
MVKVVQLNEIQAVIDQLDATEAIEQGFVAYSNHQVVVPPVGELLFEDPPGDTHIKYGYIKGQETYVIKIASGFYQNPELGLSSSSGLMLVFSQKTGMLQTILLDEGYLTNVRTALAGRIAAKYLQPPSVEAIGVLGTGIQARMQVSFLQAVTDCRKVYAWGRTPEHAALYQREMQEQGFQVMVEETPARVAAASQLLVSTTPSSIPLLQAGDVRPGTLITAVGSDTPGKQELDPEILGKADVLVADSLSQCRERGEISRALAAGAIAEEGILELGRVIQEPGLAVLGEDSLCVVDLTGVAVQDVQIASAVCAALEASS